MLPVPHMFPVPHASSVGWPLHLYLEQGRTILACLHSILLGLGKRPSFAWLLVPLISVAQPELWLDLIVHEILFATEPPESQYTPDISLGQTEPTAYSEVPTAFGFLNSTTIHGWTQWICGQVLSSENLEEIGEESASSLCQLSCMVCA